MEGGRDESQGGSAVRVRTERHWLGWLVIGGLALVWAWLTVALAGRSRLAGHLPLSSRYEFALSFVWAMLIMYGLLGASWRGRRLDAFGSQATIGVLLAALLVAAYALTRTADQRAVAPLLPALRSPWFPLHVLTTLIGYAALGVAAGLGLVRLRQPPSSGDSRLEETTERAMQRALALGFPWLTLGILTGAIWAHQAWGRYWGWDPKETWALITWLWYLLILHLRPLPRWGGRRLAAMLVIGFAAVLFTFVGVPWLVRLVRLESLHGF
jgi:ABC-type transport system involved in cytochrome c biogenesis permease subunit